MPAFSLICISVLAVGAAPRGVVLDFSAKWCGPCQMMNPIVSQLERQHYPIRQIDVDEQPDVASRYNVRSMPTFLLLVDGKEVKRIVGATSEAKLKELLALIPKDPEPAIIVESNPQTAQPTDSGYSAPTPRAQPEEKVAARASEPEKAKLRFQLPRFLGGRTEQTPDLDEEPIVRGQTDDRPSRTTNVPVGDALASSARIRVRDAGGVNYGSGTVIDSRVGRTLVLSCGHVFRHAKEGAAIEVDLFDGSRLKTFYGQLLDFEIDADVGLVELHTDDVWPTANVADEEYHPRKGDHVQSVGCGGGEPPTLQNLWITALNRYDGPDNIECTGVPVQGRSGGGLFNKQGEVIGVCIAADPEDERGLYAGLSAIQEFLDGRKLGHLFRSQPLAPPGRPPEPIYADASPLVPLEPVQGHDSAPDRGMRLVSEQEQSWPSRPAQISPVPMTQYAANQSVLSAAELQEIGDAEVVCIIRPLNNPKAESRVVIIHQASPKFVSYLNGEAELRQPPESGSRISSQSAGSTHANKLLCPQDVFDGSQAAFALSAYDDRFAQPELSRSTMVEASLSAREPAWQANVTDQTRPSVASEPRPYRRSASSRGMLR